MLQRWNPIAPERRQRVILWGVGVALLVFALPLLIKMAVIAINYILTVAVCVIVVGIFVGFAGESSSKAYWGWVSRVLAALFRNLPPGKAPKEKKKDNDDS